MLYMKPVEIMRATEAIGSIGAVFYFHPDTHDRGSEAGLDGFRLYFLGRGGVLGDVEPEVVASAFGYFNPTVLAKMWNSGKARIAPRDAARLFHECAHSLGRQMFSDVAGLDGFVRSASQVIAAQRADSLALFAAMKAEPVPADTPAAAMHQAMVLREMRGSVHLLALAAVGLESPVAHAIKRPNDVKMFGYEAAPVVTDDDVTKWNEAEALTDKLLTDAYAGLTDDAAHALISGTNAMHAALAELMAAFGVS